MRRILRRFGPLWRVQRQRHPRAAARLETAALAAKGGLADEVRVLRNRVAELERDHLLLAAHVATLTEQVGGGARVALADGDAEAARQRARLAAVAFYEERIGRLEAHLGRRGHARSGTIDASGRRTSGEQRETAP
ncbi:hypothetical protein [Amnibacterium kyonggiense]|uniref:Uncharacterized protein n=1 Tax=Amnibacterium kyonggiense TaxID=595671 RepID=A0A4R7FR02_9MICO|nr:hypothetical protein [Amnibacterium kyonggiense]TDS80227.1 hypothetical protein CLV52_0782 [Amnibacterium kyonggiense]